ncbi:MAG: hypothetical protein JWN56_2936 [Sphingobacteriales bacterium]|nr:hypothetical protein [Sphingobacteriales bacterium]
MKTGSISDKHRTRKPINMKNAVLLFIFSLLFAGIVKAQEPLVPVNYTLQSANDYRQYEPNVLASIQWLHNTPRSIETAKRKQVEDFLLKWIYGTPYLKVVIEPYAMKLSGNNADLLLSFIFGYTEFKLKNVTESDALVANVAGIQFLIEDYTVNISSFKKDAAIDKVIALQSSGKLAEWIKPQLSMGNKIQAEY